MGRLSGRMPISHPVAAVGGTGSPVRARQAVKGTGVVMAVLLSVGHPRIGA